MTETISPVTAPAGPQVTGELATVLAELTPQQQDQLAALLTKSGRPVGELTESVVPFVHSWLRAEVNSDFSLYENQNAMKSPPVTLDFAGSPEVALPAPADSIDTPFGTLMTDRKSQHHAEADEIPLSELSTFLHWTAGVKRHIQAYNHKEFPVRMSPSAGGLAPVDIFMVANSVEGVDKGIYYYQPDRHVLQQRDRGNMRWRLSRACIYADWIAYSPVVFVLAINQDRVQWKYGDRGYRFAHVDTGVLAQSMYLTGTALSWNTCAVAAFYDEFVNSMLALDGQRQFASLLFGASHPPMSTVLTEHRG